MMLRLRSTLDAEIHPRRWFVFVLLLILSRGLLLLCVLPGLEGWDEFQHLGYVDYLDRVGHAPVVMEGRMDRTFLEAIAKHPQSRTTSFGARTYEAYWNHSPAAQLSEFPSDGIVIYEAQHPPGYYWMVLPIWRAMGGVSNLVRIVFVLRVLNLSLMVGAAGIFMATFRFLMPMGQTWRWASAVLAVHPLFLLTGVRVANDALSLLAASVVIYLTVRWMAAIRGERAWWWGWPVMLGMALGASAWTKPTILALLSVVFGVPLVVGWRKKDGVRLGRRVVSAVVVGMLFSIIAGPYFLHNLRLYHSFTPIYEEIENGGVKTLADYFAALGRIPWAEELQYPWFGRSLWVGGWSFLRTERWIRDEMFEPLMMAGLLLAVIRAGRRRRDAAVVRSVGFGLAVCSCFSAALAVHALQTFAFRGAVANGPWYAAAAWPLELLMVTVGYAALPWRGIGKALCVTLMGTCMLAELQGTLVKMPREYTSTRSAVLALHRLAELRPEIFGTPTLIILAVLVVAMGVTLILTILVTRDVDSLPQFSLGQGQK